MRILSFYFGHDSNCTFFEDGKVIAVVEKERLSRIKHDQGFIDVSGIAEALGWTPESIDYIAFNPYVRPTLDGQQLHLSYDQENLYTHNLNYNERGLSCKPEDRFSEHRLNLFGRSYTAYAVDHHLAHAAGAYYQSPFSDSCILSSDGGGDDRYNMLAHASGPLINTLEYDFGIHDKCPGAFYSIGSMWAGTGENLFGYGRLEGAGKLMALASYTDTDDAFVDEHVERIATYYPAGGLANVLMKKVPYDPKEEHSKIVARGLQRFTTGVYMKASSRALEVYGDQFKATANLCMTGGCSMNCVATSAVHHSGAWDNTYVPAQPHDGGLSLGMALFVYHHVLGNPRTALAPASPFLGSTPNGAQDVISDSEIAAIIKRLQMGDVVGVCTGRAESGPRALGHRTLFFDPRNETARERLNTKIKHREWYRPFAGMVLEEHYDKHFSDYVPSRYMSYLTSAEGLPAITHVDGTTRPQVVSKDDEWADVPRRILEAWYGETECPVLGNTSFNSQEPLVNTDEEARATWKRTDLDCVYTGSRGLEIKDRSKTYTGFSEKSLVCIDGIQTFSKPYLDVLDLATETHGQLDSKIMERCNKADVVWAEWGNELAVTVSKHLKPGPKLVVRIHAYEVHQPPSPPLAAGIKWDRVDCVIVVSPRYKQLAIDWGAPEDKTVIIPTGVDTSAFSWNDKRLLVDEPRKTILCVGRLELKKGSNILPILARSLPDYKFKCVGYYTDDKIKSLFEHAQMFNYEHVDHVDHQKLNQLFEEAAYILCTSPSESFGVAIGEGMAAGCKPLIYNYPGAADTWPEEFLWDDIPSLERLLKAPLHSGKYRDYVTERYDLKHCTLLFKEKIEELLK